MTTELDTRINWDDISTALERLKDLPEHGISEVMDGMRIDLDGVVTLVHLVNATRGKGPAGSSYMDGFMLGVAASQASALRIADALAQNEEEQQRRGRGAEGDN